jgi:hypothetical protein
MTGSAEPSLVAGPPLRCSSPSSLLAPSATPRQVAAATTVSSCSSEAAARETTASQSRLAVSIDTESQHAAHEAGLVSRGSGVGPWHSAHSSELGAAAAHLDSDPAQSCLTFDRHRPCRCTWGPAIGPTSWRQQQQRLRPLAPRTQPIWGCERPTAGTAGRRRGCMRRKMWLHLPGKAARGGARTNSDYARGTTTRARARAARRRPRRGCMRRKKRRAAAARGQNTAG